MPLTIDPPIEILKESDISGIHPLDDPGMHITDPTQPSDDLTQQHYTQISGILLDPQIDLRPQLIAGGGQPHHPMPMNDTPLIDIPPRQLELELGTQPAVGNGSRAKTTPGTAPRNLPQFHPLPSLPSLSRLSNLKNLLKTPRRNRTTPHSTTISSNTMVTVSVAAEDSPAFSEGPSHLEAHPCIS